MTATQWQPVANLQAEKLSEARHQFHSAVQWLARMASSYRGSEPENENLALLWDPERQTITTQELAHALGMQITLPQLVMQFTEGGKPVRHDFETEGHSPAHVEAWILVELLHRGVDRDKFSKTLPYDVSQLMTGDGVEFSPEHCANELDALSSWYANAAAFLTQAARDAGGMSGKGSELRLWPQDLSLETLVPLEGASATEDRAVRIGFSPGDGGAAEPHFFVARRERGEARSRRPDATLATSDLPAGESAGERIRSFFKSAVAAARKSAAQ